MSQLLGIHGRLCLTDYSIADSKQTLNQDLIVKQILGDLEKLQEPHFHWFSAKLFGHVEPPLLT